jgi:hypothetical protein
MKSLFYKPPSEAPSLRPTPLRERSFVAVYSDTAQSRFITYAQIKSHQWAPIPAAYIYELIGCQGSCQPTAWDFHCRAVDASEIRQLFMLIRNPRSA